MWRHTLAAVPWALVAASTALIALLIALVEYDPWRLWPLQGIGVGLLAAATAWCLDEPAAAVVDPSPRSLAWRTVARSPAVLLLVAAWLAGVWWARESLFGHADVVALHGLAAALLAVAWVTLRRAAGDATPGQRFALAVVPLTTAWALVRPLEAWLPVFPYGPGADWTASAVGWTAAGSGAALVLTTLLITDGRVPRPRNGHLATRNRPGEVVK